MSDSLGAETPIEARPDAELKHFKTAALFDEHVAVHSAAHVLEESACRAMVGATGMLCTSGSRQCRQEILGEGLRLFGSHFNVSGMIFGGVAPGVAR